MIKLQQHYFGYMLVQCADEERGEILNVGVLVFDAARQLVECRTLDSLDRVERTLPNVPVPHVRMVLDHAQESAAEALMSRGVEGMADLHADAHGTVRFTPVRSIRGGSIERTAAQLLERYVELPERMTRGGSGGHHDDHPGSQFSSRRVINSVATRLRRFKLVEGKDFVTNATVLAKTGNLEIPVWFPLRVRQDIYLDGVDVKTDLNRTLDTSRAILQKIVEAHRAQPRARMNVLIRDPEMGEAGEKAKALIEEGADSASRVLSVSRYAHPPELDSWVHHTLEPEFADG